MLFVCGCGGLNFNYIVLITRNVSAYLSKDEYISQLSGNGHLKNSTKNERFKHLRVCCPLKFQEVDIGGYFNFVLC